MLTKVRSILADNRDASQLVARAKKISIQVPGLGKVGVPSPDQLAFYGVLGLLAAGSVIDWPVAVAIGVGQAVAARQFGDHSRAEHEDSATQASAPRAATSAKKAPAKKVPAKRRPAKATAAKRPRATA